MFLHCPNIAWRYSALHRKWPWKGIYDVLKIIHQVSNSTETRILFFYQKYLPTKVEEQAASSICFLTWRDPAGPPKDTFCYSRDLASFEETPSEFLKWCHKNTWATKCCLEFLFDCLIQHSHAYTHKDSCSGFLCRCIINLCDSF